VKRFPGIDYERSLPDVPVLPADVMQVLHCFLCVYGKKLVNCWVFFSARHWTGTVPVMFMISPKCCDCFR